jgi:hypothetical protein
MIWSERGCRISRLSTRLNGWIGWIKVMGGRRCIAIVVSSERIALRMHISFSWISRRPRVLVEPGWLIGMVDGRPSMIVVVVLIRSITMERWTRLVWEVLSFVNRGGFSKGLNDRCSKNRIGWDSRGSGRLDCMLASGIQDCSQTRLGSRPNSILGFGSRCGNLRKLGSWRSSLLRFGSWCGNFLRLGGSRCGSLWRLLRPRWEPF